MQPVFVLVEPKVPENVGAAARALKTMGFSQLWIVNSDAHRAPPARWLAHGSEEILDQARHFPDLAAVRAQAELLIGTSAKVRHEKRDLYEPAILRQVLGNKSATLKRAALVFGREDRGLSNQELAHCDLVSGIPLAVDYPSLNLAQAVMLYAYELARQTSTPAPEAADGEGAWRRLRGRVAGLLPRLDVEPDSKLSRWALERLPLLGDKDIGFLHTLCQNLERHFQRGSGQRTEGRAQNGTETAGDKPPSGGEA